MAERGEGEQGEGTRQSVDTREEVSGQRQCRKRTEGSRAAAAPSFPPGPPGAHALYCILAGLCRRRLHAARA